MKTHISPRLLDTILYLLAELEEPVPLTKLTKLLFLLDYTYHKITGRTYTKVVWMKYLYGPWSYEVYCAKDILVENFLIKEVQETKRDKTLKLVEITSEGLRYILSEKLHETIQKDTVLKEIIRGLTDYAQTKSIDEIKNLVYDIPEVKYTVQGKKIKFLKNPVTILEQISRRLEELLNKRPRTLSFDKIDNLLNELKEKIKKENLKNIHTGSTT